MPPKGKGKANRGRRGRGGGRRTSWKTKPAAVTGVTTTAPAQEATATTSEPPISAPFTSDVTIGSNNVLRWTTLKETHGYRSDTDFATFLLGLAEQIEPPKMASTESNEKPGANDGGNDTDGADGGNGSLDRDDGRDHNKDSERSTADGGNPAVEGPQGEREEASEVDKNEAPVDDKVPCEEEQADEFNESPSEDDKDIDWTPNACQREMRCTRQSVRVATLKSRQGLRQTRSRIIKAPNTQKTKLKLKRSSPIVDVRRVSPISITVTPLVANVVPSTTKLPERIRQCVDCSQKHVQGDCPLTRPVIVVADAVIVSKDGSCRHLADLTLPKTLKLASIDKRHGLSVIATEKISQYTQFGPLVGERIEEADIHEDMDLKHIWEIFGSDFKLYMDTANENASNWLRHLRPATSKCERNMSAIARQDSLYFVTTKDVDAGTELVYWADDPTSSWSKKKLEKTSCGGCNQRFCHPLYYRMHCVIFHDPNYSLTIRKYHCKICGIAILGKENIMRHASEMHDGKGAYQCQYCKKFFLRLNYLDMHRTYGCKLNPRRSRPLCDLCGKKFCQPQKLKVHIRRMHSDIAEVLKEFQCKSCFKLLGSRAALQRHLKEVHNKDQNIAATCDRCGKTFQNKSNLKIHMLTHSGVKPFRCIENGCMAAFTTKQCLQFHYKKVHGYTMDTMPAIERCIAYTFESYSGGASDGEGTVEYRESASSRLDDPKSMASIVTLSNTDLNSSSMCSSSSMVQFPPPSLSKDAVDLVTNFEEQRGASMVIEQTWLDDQKDNDDSVRIVPSPIVAVDSELALDVMSRRDSQPEVTSSFVTPREDPEVVSQQIRLEDSTNVNSPELVMDHQPDVNEASIKSEYQQQQQQQQQQQREMESDQIAPTMDVVDEDDVEPMDDSSDIDLETDIDDNSVSDHSLEHLNPEDVEEDDEEDSSDAMGGSPQRTRPGLNEQQEADMIGDVERIHARNMAMYNMPAASLLRLSDKHSDGCLKDFSGDVVSACDFAVVRQYAASMALHTDYGLQMSRHCTAPSMDEEGDLHQHHENGHAVHHDDVNVGQHSAEDLRSQLSRYEQQLSRGGVDMNSPHVKTEEDEEILVTVSKSGGTRMDHADDSDLLIAPDDDEDNDDDVDDDDEADERERQQQQREDMEAALVLAHQDHQQNEGFLKENDFVHHTPPPPLPPPPQPLPHLSRDLDRLSMHSLDLSIPRSTAHLLEHFSRTNPHVLEHLASRVAAATAGGGVAGGGGGGGGPNSPSLSSQENQSTSHSSLHLGQLGVQFHGMVDSLPRPLPHRMDHVIGHHHHLQSSLDHMSSRAAPSHHDDVMMDSHNIMDPMSPPMKSHTAPLDSHMGQSPHSYVVDHLTRYTTSQHHTMDHAFPRSHVVNSGGSSSSSLIDPLLRAGMEAAALARPSPRSGRSFTAYGVEHSVGASQSLSSSYLLQSERLSRPPSAYGLEHRATPHSLDLTTSRGGGSGGGGGGGGEGGGASNGSGSMDSPSQSHDSGGRGNGGISPSSSYGQGNSPPIMSSSSSSTSSFQDPSKLPTSLSSTVNSQLPPASSPALSSASSIHATYPTYLEYY